MSEELKPCPFCGGKPKEYDQIGYSSVKCKPCNFSLTVKAPDGPPYAPERWNTRAELSALKAGQGEAWKCSGCRATSGSSCNENGCFENERDAPPASADAVSVPIELARRLTSSDNHVRQTARRELRVLIYSQGVKP